MKRTLQLGGLVLVCRGAPPPEGFRPLSPLFAKAKLRNALHDGGGPRLLAFAEEWLGVRRPRFANTLDLRESAREAVRRIEDAIEFSSVLAFERPMAIHAGPGDRPEPAPEKKEREVFASALVVTVVDEAGKPVPGAEVAKNAAGVGPTKDDGGHVLGTIDPGTYKIEAVKEGYRATAKSVQVAPEQTAQVQLKLEKIVGRLVWPAAGAAHKQYVNLDRDPNDRAAGNVIQIQVGVVGGGKAGDKLYLKIDWDDAKVSKRNSPVRQVVGGTTAGWCPKSGTTVTLKRDGEEPIVQVDLGLAGGDEIKVSMGGTTECKDASCTITTWRRLWYELFYPDFMPLEGDFAAGSRKRIDRLLLPNFIEYRLWKAHPFAESAATPGTVLPPKYFRGSNSARKHHVLSDYSFLVMPANVARDGGKRPRSIDLRLCDRCFVPAPRNDDFWDVVFKQKRVKVTPPWFFLPKSCSTGGDAIRDIAWIAEVGAHKFPDHPALQGGQPRGGNLSLADVTYDDEFGFFVTLPDGTADDPGPGRLVGPLGPTTCPIRVGLFVETAVEVNGLSLPGGGVNAVRYLPNAPEVMADVLIHELCHNAGMAAIGENAPPPGIPKPKTTDEFDPEENCRGHLYVGHQHHGPHCARGLSDEQKAGDTYRGISMRGTCVNFGQSPEQDPSPFKDLVCKTCSTILKGRELRKL